MPINEKRLRLDTLYRQRIIESIEARKGGTTSSAAGSCTTNDQDTTTTTIENLVQLMHQSRQLQAHVEEYRAEIRRKTEGVSKETLREKIGQLERLQIDIKRGLNQLPNVLAEEKPFTAVLETNKLEPPQEIGVQHQQRMDPLYDIQAYETVKGEQFTCCWTARGHTLTQALQTQLHRFLNLHDISYHGLPFSELDKIVQSLYQTKYYDSNLPLCATFVAFCDNIQKDIRERQRQQSWKHCKIPTMHSNTLIQLNAVTGPSEMHDSSPFQRRILLQLLQFYRLLGPSVRIRQIPASQLDSAEACRWVLESEMKGKPVCLAYVSNFTDYKTSTTLHGNTGQPVHSVNGTICSLTETLVWMAYHSSTSEGVKLPPVLRLSTHLYPYCRQVSVNAKGKRVVSTQSSSDLRNHQQMIRPLDVSTLRLPAPTNLIQGESSTNPFDFLPMY